MDNTIIYFIVKSNSRISTLHNLKAFFNIGLIFRLRSWPVKREREREREREKERERQRQRQRQTAEKEKDRHTDRQTDRQRSLDKKV